MVEGLDGLLTFFASHHAIRAEKTLRKEGFAAKLIPGPKELSPNCGVAVRFEYSEREAALECLRVKRVQVDEVHPYQPETDQWEKPARAGSKWSWRNRRS